MTIAILLLVLTFILGTAIGSFINALVYRLHEGLSIIAARSICPKCKKPISDLDLIPIVSYLILRGRCRHCGKTISPQYPVVELLTGVFFAASFWSYFVLDGIFSPVEVTLFFIQLVFISILMALLVYDFLYMELPDRIILPALAFAVLADIAKFALGVWQFRDLTGRIQIGPSLLADPAFVSSHVWEIATPILYGAAAGLVLAAIFYLIVYLSKERAMGGGDIKLALLLGLILPWPYLLPAMYIGFALGAVIGIGLVLAQRKKIRQLIPLAPFLVLGTFASMFFGDFLYRIVLNFKLF
jgi:leader peptidase (prepilin peptidase) / N-methyltransferase